MNLFVLDSDHAKNAEFHVNSHVCKMPLESAQILCTVRRLYGDDTARYKMTHKNHPCVKWAAESVYNYLWVYSYGMALCKEYTFRYGKRHACQDVISECATCVPMNNEFRSVDHMTTQPQCMPLQYHKDNIVDAYRAYYLGEKFDLFKWKNRLPPYWIPKNLYPKD